MLLRIINNHFVLVIQIALYKIKICTKSQIIYIKVSVKFLIPSQTKITKKETLVWKERLCENFISTSSKLFFTAACRKIFSAAQNTRHTISILNRESFTKKQHLSQFIFIV